MLARLAIKSMGIFFALLALASWGIGDFLIQRSARKFGDWIALFYITAFASVALLPFVWRDILILIKNHGGLVTLIIASVLMLFAALFDFEALRIGKISVVEPIYAMEVPVTALLALAIIGERLTFPQTVLIGVLLFGIFLISTRSFKDLRHIRVERGVWYAIFATVGMGGVNFLFGLGARETSPLLINWFTSVFVALVATGYLLATGGFGKVIDDWKHSKRLIISVSIIDNAAWIAFTYSALYIPIAITTSISESYIVLAAGLGLLFNKEKLRPHQFAGLLMAVVAVIVLSAITEN